MGQVTSVLPHEGGGGAQTTQSLQELEDGRDGNEYFLTSFDHGGAALTAEDDFLLARAHGTLLDDFDEEEARSRRRGEEEWTRYSNKPDLITFDDLVSLDNGEERDVSDGEEEYPPASASASGQEESKLQLLQNLSDVESKLVDKYREYARLHHDIVPIKNRDKSNLFYRPQGQSPGWHPGGRFAFREDATDAIHDLQEREIELAKAEKKKFLKAIKDRIELKKQRVKKHNRGAQAQVFSSKFDQVLEHQETMKKKAKNKSLNATMTKQRVMEESCERMEKDLQIHQARELRHANYYKQQRIQEVVDRRLHSLARARRSIHHIEVEQELL